MTLPSACLCMWCGTDCMWLCPASSRRQLVSSTKSQGPPSNSRDPKHSLIIAVLQWALIMHNVALAYNDTALPSLTILSPSPPLLFSSPPFPLPPPGGAVLLPRHGVLQDRPYQQQGLRVCQVQQGQQRTAHTRGNRCKGHGEQRTLAVGVLLVLLGAQGAVTVVVVVVVVVQ